MKTIPDKVTIHDKYSPAMEITDQAEADAYFEQCVEHHLRCAAQEGLDITREKAEDIERSNLGYHAGYYSHETRERVERLFRCAHPVFGKIAENGAPDPEEVLKKGIEMGKRAAKVGSR